MNTHTRGVSFGSNAASKQQPASKGKRSAKELLARYQEIRKAQQDAKRLAQKDIGEESDSDSENDEDLKKQQHLDTNIRASEDTTSGHMLTGLDLEQPKDDEGTLSAPQCKLDWVSLDSVPERLQQVYQVSKAPKNTQTPKSKQQNLDYLLDKTIDTLNVSVAVSADESIAEDFDDIGKENSTDETNSVSSDSENLLNITQAARISQSGSHTSLLDSSSESEPTDGCENEKANLQIVSSTPVHESGESKNNDDQWSTSKKVLSPVEMSKSPSVLDPPGAWQGSDDSKSLSNADDQDSISLFSSNAKMMNDVSAMMTPITTMKKNNIDVALAESEMYMDKIKELMNELDNAKRELSNQNTERNLAEERSRTFQAEHEATKIELEHFRQKWSTDKSILIAKGDKDEKDSLHHLRAEVQKLEQRNDQLMERNETLVKECKFADQTCVEVGCKNSALEQEVDRLKGQLQDAKKENEELHHAMIRSARQGSKVESELDAIMLRTAAEKSKLEARLDGLSQNLLESKQTNDLLSLKVEKLQRENYFLSVQHSESKEENTVDSVDVTSIAQSQIDELYSKLKDTNESVHSHQRDLQKEKTRARKYREERDTLRQDMKKLEQVVRTGLAPPSDDFSTPTKAAYKHLSKSVHTPTSQVLAKTLQSELYKSQEIRERLSKTEDKLCQHKLESESLHKKLDSSIQAEAMAQKEAKVAIKERDSLLAEFDACARLVVDVESQLCRKLSTQFSSMTIDFPVQHSNVDTVGRILTEKLHSIQSMLEVNTSLIVNSHRVLENALSTSSNSWAKKSDVENMSRCSLIHSSILDPAHSSEYMNSSVDESFISLPPREDAKENEMRLEEAEEEISILKQENELYSRMTNDAQRHLESEKKRSRLLAEETDRLKSRVEGLQQNVQASESRARSLEEQLHTLKDDEQNIAQKLKSLEVSEDALKDAIEVLQVKLEEAEQQLEDMGVEQAEYEERLREKTQQLHEQNQQSIFLNQEIEVLRKESKSFLARIKSLESSKASLAKTSEELTDSLNTAKEKMHSMELQFREALLEKETKLRVTTNEANHDMAALKAKIEKDHTAWDSEKQHLVSALNRIKPDFSKLKAEYEDLKRKLKETKTVASQRSREVLDAKNRLEALATKSETEIEELKNSSRQLKMEFEEQISVLSSRLQEEAEKAQEIMAVKLDLERNSKELQQSLDTEIKAKDNVLIQMAELEDRTWREKSEMQQKYEEATKMYEDLQKKLESNERRSAKLKEYIARLTEKCEGWTECYNVQTGDLDEVREHLSVTQSKLRTWEVKCQRLEDENTTLKSDLARISDPSQAAASINEERVNTTSQEQGIQTDHCDSVAGSSKTPCRDCKYYRKVIAKEGSIKELEIAKLRQELEQKDAENKRLKQNGANNPRREKKAESERKRSAFAERTNLSSMPTSRV